MGAAWERHATCESALSDLLTGRETAVLCSGLEKNGMVGAWHGHDMAIVNQTRPHCVNQMGKAHSKPLAARHGRGTARERHAMCESPFNQFHTDPASSQSTSPYVQQTSFT